MNTESSLDTGVYEWFQKKEGTLNHHSKIIIPPKMGRQTEKFLFYRQPAHIVDDGTDMAIRSYMV